MPNARNLRGSLSALVTVWVAVVRSAGRREAPRLRLVMSKPGPAAVREQLVEGHPLQAVLGQACAELAQPGVVEARVGQRHAVKSPLRTASRTRRAPLSATGAPQASPAGPAPSGSADASRRCQGCLPPSRASPRSGCPQRHRFAATDQQRGPLTLARSNGASWRTRAYFQSIARTAIAAAWRPVGFSVDSSTVTRASIPGGKPVGTRAPNASANGSSANVIDVTTPARPREPPNPTGRHESRAEAPFVLPGGGAWSGAFPG